MQTHHEVALHLSSSLTGNTRVDAQTACTVRTSFRSSGFSHFILALVYGIESFLDGILGILGILVLAYTPWQHY